MRNDKRILVVNSITGLLNQCLTVICAFIIPRLILENFGSEVNGLIQSLSQFLGLISLLESGMGQIISSNLYNPLANSDMTQISKIFRASQDFFSRIGAIFACFSIVLAIVYPCLINQQFDFSYVFFLVLILSANYFAQYFIGWPYIILIYADQRLYLTQILSIVSAILSTIVSVVLIKLGFGIHTIKIAAALVYLSQPIIMKLYADRKYKIIHNICMNEDPIKQKWNGLAQHIAFIVATRTDAVVLTFFSTLSNISIYSVYNMALVGLSGILNTTSAPIAPFLGNLIANGGTKKICISFEYIEWILHNVVIFLYSSAALLIVPFVSVYTININDANYIAPTFALVLVLAFLLRDLRIPYASLIFAAGHFKQTQLSSIIEALLNIVISVCAVFRFGLIGVAIGTVCAMAYRTMYLVIYLSNNILFRDIRVFLKQLCVDVLAVTISLTVAYPYSNMCSNYYEWVLMSTKICSIVITLLFVINFIFFPRQIKETLKLLRIIR